MPTEIERRFALGHRMALRASSLSTRVLEIESLYFDAANFPICLLGSGAEIEKIQLCNATIFVPELKQKEFYEIIQAGMTEEKGRLKAGCSLRVRRAYNKKLRQAYYKLGIKFDTSQEKREQILQKVGDAVREEIVQQFRFKEEYEFKFEGEAVYYNFENWPEVPMVTKVRYDMSESGWDLEKVISNKKGKFPIDLWIVESELDTDLKLPETPSWARSASPIRGMSSKKMSSAEPSEVQGLVERSLARGAGFGAK